MSRNRLKTWLGVVAGVTAAGTAAADVAGDWPQLWGPSGAGVAPAGAQLSAARPTGVRELWRRPLGSGFSGISVQGTRGFTGLSDGATDHLVAFDVTTGKEAWRAPLGPTYRGHDGSKDGPISTPALDRGRAFIVNPHGVLAAFDSGSGRELWRHDLKAEYGAAAPFYGFATSPIVAGPLLVVHAGGDSHGLAAFDKATGKLAWSAAHTKGPEYSSPVLATLGGVRQLVVAGSRLLYGVRPEDGLLLWSHAHDLGEEARPPLVLPGDRVLIQAWNEARLVKVARAGDAWRAAEAWRSARLKNSYSPTVFHGGHLYGMNSGYLVCADPESGEIRWRQKVYPGSMILVDSHLVLLGEQSGDLRIVEASPEGYRERVKKSLFNAGAASSTGPSFAGGRLLLRNVEEMVALEVTGGAQ
jgi:outer membrane protein assembly factor BamB